MRHKLFTALALFALLLAPGLFPALAAQPDLRWCPAAPELAVNVAPATLFRVEAPMLAEQPDAYIHACMQANATTSERRRVEGRNNPVITRLKLARTSALSTARFYVSEVATRITPRCRDVQRLARV